jgi:hypothetical protein
MRFPLPAARTIRQGSRSSSRAIAGQLGVALNIAWVLSPIRYRSAEY